MGNRPSLREAIITEDWEKVQRILLKVPRCKDAKKCDAHGRVPIHIAARLAAPPQVITALLQAYPDAVKIKDSGGRLPLHYAFQYASRDVVAILRNAYSDGISAQDKAGKTPSDYASEHTLQLLRGDVTTHSQVFEAAIDYDWTKMLALLREAPHLAMEKGDKEGWTPLHYSLVGSARSRQNPAAPEVSLEVLALNSKAAAVQDTADQFLPLHYAVVKDKTESDVNDQKRLQLVKELLAAYPEGVSTRSTPSFSWIPLHSALAWNSDTFFQEKVVSILLDAFPRGASLSDGYGRLPLVYAVEGTSASVPCLQKIHVLHPRAIKVPCRVHENGLPLHVAVKYNAPVEVIEWMLSIYPTAGNVKDRNGRDPYDISQETNASVEVKEFLAKWRSRSTEITHNQPPPYSECVQYDSIPSEDK